MAKAKKSNLFPIIACAILLLTAILTISMLATPLFKADITNPITDEVTTKTQSAYEFLEDMNKADDDGNTVIQGMRDALAKLKEVGAEDDEVKELSNTIMLYDSLTAIIALTAIAMVAAVLALVLAVLKKNKLAFIFGLVAAVLLLATFAAACAATAGANALAALVPENKLMTMSVVAPIVALVFALIGSLAGGGLLVLKRK